MKHKVKGNDEVDECVLCSTGYKCVCVCVVLMIEIVKNLTGTRAGLRMSFDDDKKRKPRERNLLRRGQEQESVQE